MKTLKVSILIVLISLGSYAQNGINYKALIKDSNGNVIANQGIDMIFSIQFEGVSLYSELQQIITDSNGIAIATIGVGSVITGVFETIDWKLRNTELNVQIDFGNGLVDFGNSPFNAVPYAIQALNTEGLEVIDEGNGIGLRLAGSNPDFFGSIGNFAVDLSFNDVNSEEYGATGDVSTAIGRSTTSSGVASTAMGAYTQASGLFSTAMGFFTKTEAAFSTAIGRYNNGGGNPNSWVDTDPLFEVGNGQNEINTSNALTIFKNGQHTINSQNIGLHIPNASTGINISDSFNNSINILNPGFRGIYISDANADGIVISNAQENGISASGIIRGGNFSGGTVGVYARAFNNDDPDIILGSSFSPTQDDDGIISTNPERSGSDMFLRSYDAVVVQLDYDNNESGNFRIRNGADAIVFDVNESGNANLAGSLTQNSDRRLKKDIENLDYGLSEILQLHPKQYFWKNKEQNKKSLGLIAQDVQTIISEIVTSQDDELKTLGINYTELIPVLINAIKEQQNIIDNEKSINAKQSSQLEVLLSRIEDLEANQSN